MPGTGHTRSIPPASVKTIVVASTNPVKMRAVLAGFRRIFPDQAFLGEPVSVPSGVSRQPLSHAETLQGAENRACGAQAAFPGADFWVGVEGGLEPEGDSFVAFAWVVVHSAGRVGRACTAAFRLPPRVAELVRQGLELGEADDQVFGRTNSKQANGAVGLLSGDAIDRAELYEQGVILALFPFKNPELYPGEGRHG